MSLIHRALGALPRSWLKGAARLQWRHPWLRALVQRVADQLRGQDLRIAQGVGQGLWFNAGRSKAGYALGTTEPRLQGAFARLLRPGMTVYDVGASVGFQAVLAARLVGREGRVVAFEPFPENAAWARHNARLNDFGHLEVLEVAVAAADGSARFQAGKDVNWGKLDSGGALEVKVRSLDSVSAELGARPAAIKIDVEGAEASVLDGARGVLSSASPILFIDCHGTNASVAERLEPLGYRLVVLGGGGVPLREASWDAQVVALPPGLPDGDQVAEALAQQRT
ncbi:MAG TPA: FkbM family methyltransferase [Myxococcales bacterium]|nr:FkbM family methyltransferase [Myxococcales bacterium]